MSAPTNTQGTDQGPSEAPSQLSGDTVEDFPTKPVLKIEGRFSWRCLFGLHDIYHAPSHDVTVCLRCGHRPI